MIRRPWLTPLLLPLLLAAAPAAALEAAEGALTVNVFGSVGYGRTDGNVYGPGMAGGHYDNSELALALMGHASDRLLVAGQIFFAHEEVSVDWAFAEWKVNDHLRLRLGKAKHPFGNYGETQDVGTLRPFFTLPTSVYGASHLVGEGYTGAGLAGFFRLGDGWGLGYDVYGGELHAESYEAFEQILDDTMEPGALEEVETRELLGGRVTVETPVEGLALAVSGYSGTEEDEITQLVRRHSAVAGSLEFLGEALSARAEYALLAETREADTQAAYVEVAWKFPVGVQLAGRVEGSWTKADEIEGDSPLLRHREAAVGVNYWFSPDLVVKASYHLADGNRYAWTEEQTPQDLEETTHLVVLGAQFSF